MIPVYKIPASGKSGLTLSEMKAVVDQGNAQNIIDFEFKNRSFYISIQEENTKLIVYMYILDDLEIVEDISLFQVDCSEVSCTDCAVYQFIQDILGTYDLDLLHNKILETLKKLDEAYWWICQIRGRFTKFVGLDVHKNLESFDKLSDSFQKIKEFYELLDTSLQNT